MARKKSKSGFIISSIIFIISSIVLLINNLSDFFKTISMIVPLNVIAWIGIIFAVCWWVILVANGNFKGFR